MVEKQDMDHCSVLGGQQMILTGQNFSSDSKVVFMEKTQGECPGAEGINVISAQFGFCSVILHDANENAAASLPFGLHFCSDLHDVPHIESLSLTARVVVRVFDNGNFFTSMNMIKPVWKKNKKNQDSGQTCCGSFIFGKSFQFRLSKIEQNSELRCLHNITPRSTCIREEIKYLHYQFC